ncbi:MAG: rRNA pseudouridine synthase [Lachnospiraceae bacterium]|nr:rRNA pseudouridine synthase [Lachnospiraceae bacterium]
MQDNQALRINKYLASCGICSRREADVLLLSGRVRMNGEVVPSGAKVTWHDLVTVDGVPVRPMQSRILVAYNKPKGTTCTTRDVHADRTVYEDVQVFVNDRPIRLSYAGRLDRDSEGLILFTNDGDLIDKITRGKFKQEKEYLVAVAKHKDDNAPLQEKIAKLQGGVFLRELNLTTRPADVSELIGDAADAFMKEIGQEVRQVRVNDGVPLRAPKKKTDPTQDVHVLRIVLTQGLNRQIRRMCEVVGLKVLRLQRVRVMNVELNDLSPGAWRYLTEEETEGLLKLIEG